jgi:hypothetical protein
MSSSRPSSPINSHTHVTSPIDASSNITIVTSSSDVSANITVSIDTSYNIYYLDNDPSCNVDFTPPNINIIADLSTVVVNGTGYTVTTKTGEDASGNQITNIVFNSSSPNIEENLTETISMYNDETDPSGQSTILLKQITAYAAEIKCSNFHGKGSIDDYTELFQAAAKIANESKHMELNIDVEGFNEFSQAADDLSALFNGFIIKLQNVNIINDVTFLQSISTALSKIVNLSNVFGKFKEIVLATSTIQIPKSSHDASVIISGVMDEVNCAMQYINYFVDPSSNPNLYDAHLSAAEQNVVSKSVETINSWNVLCQQGISIAMANDVDIQNIKIASNQLKTKTTNLKSVTSTLKSKLASFNILC